MALANVTYPSDGTVLNYLITFDYLDRTHIAVFVDGVDTTDVSSAFTFELTDDTHVDVTTLAGAPVPSGSTIKIARITPTNTTATVFADGAVVRASALNANTDQLLFISQEVKDNDAFRMGVDNDDKFDALNKIIKNVANPVNAQDAATKDYLENTWLTLSDKAQLNSLNITNLNTVATDIANVNTSATNIADINTVAARDSDIDIVAARDADIGIVSARDTDIGIAAARDADIGTVASRDTDIGTVAARDADIGTVAARDADIATVALRDSDIGTLGPISADITTTAGISTDVTTVSSVSTDVTSLANALSSSVNFTVTVAGGVFVIDGASNPTLTFDRGNTYVFDVSDSSVSGHPLAFKDGSGTSYTTGVTSSGTAGSSGATVTIVVAANAPSSLRYYCTVHGNGMGNTIATVSNNFGTVAASIGSINDVAGQISPTNNIATVAANISNINAVGGVSADVSTVAGIASDVTAAATNATDISAIAAEVAKVITVANDLNEATSEIDVVANNIANVNLVGADITAVINASNNLSDINNFGDTYFISATAPTSPTQGDLWFDTDPAALLMKVYDGNGFVNAGSSVNGTSERSSYTATAGQTSFAATYDAGYVDVYLNGIKLISGTDFTATSGTNIVLASGAALNDTVDIVAYGTFELANVSLDTLSDATASGASSGDVLTYNGSVFAPAAPTVPTLSSLNIANHDQVTVTAGGAVTATSYAGDGSALTGVEAFASGTKMLFGQTAAPTGWTKITTDDDAALRIVSGTVGSGGSSGLSTALATPTVTGTIAGSTGAHTLTIAEIPSHSHTSPASYYTGGSNVAVSGYLQSFAPSGAGENRYAFFNMSTTSVGGGGSHSHSLSATFSGGTAAINVKYVDVIMASKD